MFLPKGLGSVVLLKYFYDFRLVQAWYVLDCKESGNAPVVDPARDVRPYVQVAQGEGLASTHIDATHIHADFVWLDCDASSACGKSLGAAALNIATNMPTERCTFR